MSQYTTKAAVIPQSKQALHQKNNDLPPTVPIMSLKPQDSVKTGGVGIASAAPAAGRGTQGRKNGNLDPSWGCRDLNPSGPCWLQHSPCRLSSSAGMVNEYARAGSTAAVARCSDAGCGTPCNVRRNQWGTGRRAQGTGHGGVFMRRNTVVPCVVPPTPPLCTPPMRPQHRRPWCGDSWRGGALL